MAITRSILDLPKELKRRISYFLDPEDVEKVASTSRSMRCIRLSRLEPFLIVPQVLWSTLPDQGEEEFEAFHIPTLTKRVHSFELTLRFRDQGWGNRKGKFFVVRKAKNLDASKRFKGGELLYESDLAEHTVREVSVRIGSSGYDVEIWARIGGGGGHQIYFEDVRVAFTLFDQTGSFGRNFECLRQCGAFDTNIFAKKSSNRDRFYLTLLNRTTIALKRQLVDDPENIDLALASALTDHGIPLTIDSLSAVEELLQAFLETSAKIREVKSGHAPNIQRDETASGLNAHRILVGGPVGPNGVRIRIQRVNRRNDEVREEAINDEAREAMRQIHAVEFRNDPAQIQAAQELRVDNDSDEDADLQANVHPERIAVMEAQNAFLRRHIARARFNQAVRGRAGERFRDEAVVVERNRRPAERQVPERVEQRDEPSFFQRVLNNLLGRVDV